MTLLEIALSERQVAQTRRKARALRERMVDVSPRATVEVDAAALATVLRFVDAAKPASPMPLPTGKRTGNGRTAAPVPATSDEEISPEEAAGLLGMSRPSVMRLIARGCLHPRKVLSRNRLSRAEVLAFARRNRAGQRQALTNLSALSEEYGF